MAEITDWLYERLAETEHENRLADEVARCEAGLTKAQWAILAEVREAGVKTYNGRARKSIEILERKGLVTTEFDLRPHAKGSGIEFTQMWIVRPVGQ